MGEASHPGPRLGNRVESRRIQVSPSVTGSHQREPLRDGGAHCPLSLTVLTRVWWVCVVVFGEGVSPNVAVCLRTF